jgi:hypothetical protein
MRERRVESLVLRDIFDRNSPIISTHSLDRDLHVRVRQGFSIPGARPVICTDEGPTVVVLVSVYTIARDSVGGGRRYGQDVPRLGLDYAHHRLEGDDQDDVSNENTDQDLGGLGHGWTPSGHGCVADHGTLARSESKRHSIADAAALFAVSIADAVAPGMDGFAPDSPRRR